MTWTSPRSNPPKQRGLAPALSSDYIDSPDLPSSPPLFSLSRDTCEILDLDDLYIVYNSPRPAPLCGRRVHRPLRMIYARVDLQDTVPSAAVLSASSRPAQVGASQPSEQQSSAHSIITRQHNRSC